jgi:hypothetical protein
MKTLVLASGLAVAMLAAGNAPACSVGAMDRKALSALSARSDIVAIGSVQIISEQVKEEGTSRRTTGVARFVATNVIINRTTRSRPFQFEYGQVEDQGCLFGALPIEGGRVKIYLRESATLPRKLQLLYLEGV